MLKAAWCSIVVATAGATAAISTSYTIGELVSYRTCGPAQWEYPFNPTWLPTAITAFLALGAVALAWSWRKSGPIINGIRLFFLLISLLYLYVLIDQNRLIEYHPDRFLFLSCGGENWKDFEEISVGTLMFLGLPMFAIILFLFCLANAAFVLLRPGDTPEGKS